MSAPVVTQGARSTRAYGWGCACLWLCLASTASCGGGGEVEPPEGPRVVLGSGQLDYEPLASGAEIPLIAGIQGGFHVWTNFVLYGFGQLETVRMELATSWQDGSAPPHDVAGNVSVRPFVDAAGNSALSSYGWPAVLEAGPCSHGRSLHVELVVRDMAAGTSAQDQRNWVVIVDPMYRRSNCD